MFDSNLIKNANKLFDVFICGEILVDIIEDYEGNDHRLFGGSPANIAINTTQLGLKTALFSVLSQDDMGVSLKQTLEFYHVDTTYLSIVKEPQSYVKLKQTDATPIPIFFRGSDFLLNTSDGVLDAVSKSKIFHFSYWPMTREPSKTTVLNLIQEAKKYQTLVAFDPNIHEALQSEDSLSPMALENLLYDVDIIKPSLDDAARLFGPGLSKEDYMTRFENFNIPLILMTLGKEGVYVSALKERTLFASKALEVIDATGAGDAFWSGLYSGLIEGLSLPDVIALAQEVSARVLKALGAITVLPHYKHILEGES